MIGVTGMEKQQAKGNTGEKWNKHRYMEALKLFIKSPMYLVFATITLIALLEVAGYYIHNYLDHKYPFAEGIVGSILFSALLIPAFSIMAYYVRKYIIVTENSERAEAKFESVVNNIKEAVFQTDAHGLWTFLNPAWGEITGYTLEESIGKNFIEFVHPEDRERNTQLFIPLIERKKEYCRHEIRYITKDKSYRWVEVFARLTLDGGGNIVGTSGTLMDITKRKEMENELINREKLMQGVAEATTILLKTMDQNVAFNKALEVLGKVTRADRVYIFQNQHHPITHQNVVSQRYEWCNESIDPQIDNQESQNICYKRLGFIRWYEVLSSGKEICGFAENFPIEERKSLEEQGIISTVVVPICVDAVFWGFLGFDDCTKAREWTNSEISLLNAAAASIGSAIKRSEDELHIQRLLKNDLKQTVQNLQNLVFKCKKQRDNEIYFTLFEGKIAEQFGLTTDTVFEKGLDAVLGLETANILRKHLERAFQGEVCSFEIKYRENIYYTSLSPIREGKEVMQVVGSAIDISDLKRAEDQIHYMAYYDTLTGLPNRAFFREQMNYLLSHAHRNNHVIVIMFLDLDRFKLINDTLGHMAGDELLKITAHRLKEAVREVDMVVRMGGDEFILLFPEVSEESNISKLAEKVLHVFKESFVIAGHEIYISTSIGISLYPHDGKDIDTLIKNADTAMYRAKENGRNNYQFYTDNMNERAVKRLEMEYSLRKALEKEELFMVYQPRIDLKTKKVLGSEALIRWDHPTMGLISPTDFIPIAEETGLILPIGEWVLYTACRQARLWNDDGYSNLRVSINISAVQFHKENLVETIKRIVSETKLEPKLLELEITENIIMQNTERTVQIIRDLKEMGIQIAIDDFGTGFSSLSYIKEFEADTIKVDRSFIRDIGISMSNESIITAIVNMAHSLDMTVVAEGVETEGQLAFLSSRNCDEVQGYLFSKPVGPIEFRALLEDRGNSLQCS